MARFDTALDEVFPVARPPEVVAAHFADRDAIIRATTQAERTTVHDDGRVHFVLQTQQHGPYSFQPDYVVEYTETDGRLTWKTTEGNMVYEGEAEFTARADGGTDVRYHGRIGFDLPIPRLVAGPLRGVVAKIAQPSIRRYVEAMVASVPTA